MIPAIPPAAAGTPFDAAPFGRTMDGEVGIVWEDPREVRRVVLHFRSDAPRPDGVRLEYWGSRWPDQRVPDDHEPGGGGVGWWELGNWYQGGWRAVDAQVERGSRTLTFVVRPVNRSERTDLKDCPADYRFTLQVRILAEKPLPRVERIEAETRSTWREERVRVVTRDGRPVPALSAFNGVVLGVEPRSGGADVRLLTAATVGPNSFDRTLLTIGRGAGSCTLAPSDLAQGPVVVPERGLALLEAGDTRDYASALAAVRATSDGSLYDRIAVMPEQTWGAAWGGMPAKKRPIVLPLGVDGGRSRFCLNGDGSVTVRPNTHFIRVHPGGETSRVERDGDSVIWRFGLPDRPASRWLLEEWIPICSAEYSVEGARIAETALATTLDGLARHAGAPPGDALTVCMLRFTVSGGAATRSIPLRIEGLRRGAALEVGVGGAVMLGERTVASVEGGALTAGPAGLAIRCTPGAPVTVKIPCVSLGVGAETAALHRLEFGAEAAAAEQAWRRLDRGMRLTTPEPELNGFHRSHATHLLINSEREPGSDVRFARVSSFSYGAYSNESCMMVVDMDRRGMHEEARQCLEAWLKYQGTVALPGDFSSREGVLYGAGGYEAGGYNQHHGWVLWCLAEHFRFTRDRDWLAHAAPGILAGAEWIVRERARTAKRGDIARGLLPAGSLEDIGDWWPWLSTNCYTWRGLDSAAWALAEIGSPEAARLRREADAYRREILGAFAEASRRSPVVRLRDGTSVAKTPSMPYRRGRSFGWICETLEGAIHLLITGLVDAHSPQAAAILKDYEDNLYLSNQYGYTVPDFGRQWFALGGMSMQSCLLFHVEPYLMRDDVKHALRGLFNAIAVGYFPDVQMITEHALPEMGDWAGDHLKSSDEANACGWLRQLFVREAGDELWVGQALPRAWLAPGKRCGLERAATHFGPMGVTYTGAQGRITAALDGPVRNAPRRIRLRFRTPGGEPITRVTVNGRSARLVGADTVTLPGGIGRAIVVAEY